MTLNVPEAEERARKLYHETPGVEAQAGLLSGDFLALAVLARELAEALDRQVPEDASAQLLCDKGCRCRLQTAIQARAKARAAGLLLARDSAPAEPK
jgi:hypothetical protein